MTCFFFYWFVQRTSKNEGDLVAKCYFAKKKLVWELLKGGLKSKIEIQWNDIIAISAVMKENEPGVLQIEVILIFLRFHFEFLSSLISITM